MDRHCSNYAVVLFVILISLNILNRAADGRELRPSEHGLGSQDSSSGNASEMLSFFGGSPESSELPEARNLTASLWNGGGRSNGESSRDGKKDDAVREVLFVASMVCGLTGVVLVVASAFLLIFRLRKRKSETTSLSEANVAHK